MQKNHFWPFDVVWYFKLWRIPLWFLFLLFRTFYASSFCYKIEYSLATDIATSFTCFKLQYYTRKSGFYLFSMVENPVKPSITKSLKNLDKQDKIDYSLVYRNDRSGNSGGILTGVRDNIKISV